MYLSMHDVIDIRQVESSVLYAPRPDAEGAGEIEVEKR